MKFPKIEPVRGSAVSPYKERKKMLKNLDNQIAEEFFMIPGKTGTWVLGQAGKLPASQAHMGPVIGKACV